MNEKWKRPPDVSEETCSSEATQRSPQVDRKNTRNLGHDQALRREISEPCLFTSSLNLPSQTHNAFQLLSQQSSLLSVMRSFSGGITDEFPYRADLVPDGYFRGSFRLECRCRKTDYGQGLRARLGLCIH